MLGVQEGIWLMALRGSCLHSVLVGIMTGAFYSVSTLFNQMFLIYYRVSHRAWKNWEGLGARDIYTSST